MKRSLLISIALLGAMSNAGAQSRNFTLGKWTEIQNAILKELSHSYVDSLPIDKIERKGIDAMLSGLDPYTVYIPEEENEDLQLMIHKKYGGIGAVIYKPEVDGNVIITEPYKNSAAEKYGLVCGDEILAIDGVDSANVMTNSVLEVAEVFGIEAARNSIVHEAVTTLSEAGLDVDIRHIMLVADLMTNDGQVKAIGRHGVSGKKSSVLARAAFEITAAHLLHAAMVGEVDHLEGVTENIIVGQPVTLGTGAVNLIYTPKKKGDKE